MPEQLLEAHVRSAHAVAVIDLHGILTSLTADVLTYAYEAARTQTPSAILLHFGAVGYINSGGIGQVLSLLAQEQADGRRLLACGLSEFYIQLLRLTRQVDEMCLFADEASAFAELGLTSALLSWRAVYASSDSWSAPAAPLVATAEAASPLRSLALPHRAIRFLETWLIWTCCRLPEGRLLALREHADLQAT